MANPKPGSPVRGSTTGRPIMALLDLLGRRWSLRILWELRSEPLTFRELRDACENMSPSVLNQRVDELRAAGILENSDHGYALTTEGLDLMESLTPLHFWAEKWSNRR
ncbi:MAG: helix-turn-helix domain-containing protein [Candidatus Hydrogenedentota bacterium]